MGGCVFTQVLLGAYPDTVGLASQENITKRRCFFILNGMERDVATQKNFLENSGINRHSS